jgi:phosphoribosylformylglycinamidine synthase
MDLKAPGDLVYILGMTRDELGGSEYYEHLGYVGKNVPEVFPERFLALYRALQGAIAGTLTASVKGIYRGGLGVNAVLAAAAGGLGLDIDLTEIPTDQFLREDRLLFSESAGRFLVTVPPKNRHAFEDAVEGNACGCIGTVTDTPRMLIKGQGGQKLVDLPLDQLKTAWKALFGDLV